MSKPFDSFVARFKQGDRIFGEGEPGATMFIVQSGCVRLCRDAGGQPRDLGVMEKGDFFGEMSILEGLPRTSTATAVDNVELIEINSTTFDRMIKSNIEIAIRLLRKLSIRLRDAERKNAELQASGAVAAPRPSAVSQGEPERPVGAGGARLLADDGQTVFSVSSHDCMIGRFDPVTELTPDIDLTDVDLKRSVSRRHARIVTSEEGAQLIEEVGALNGTLVNGSKLIAGQYYPLHDGDEIGIGTVMLTFRT